jgi:phosphopantetheine--protein transferase-like protein
MGPSLAVGVDHVVIDDIAASLATFGRGYERRIITDAERTSAADRSPAAYLGFLAGRFAGKEAIVKALRYPRSKALAWTDIEILAHDEGWPLVTLHGPARQHAAATGISEVSVSISHEGTLAIAVAIAQRGRRGSRPERSTTESSTTESSTTESSTTESSTTEASSNRVQHQRGDTTVNETQIRDVLLAHGRLGKDPMSISIDDDLYEAGMTSHASVNVMLGLEDTFDIEFPDELLRRGTFQTIRAIDAAVTGLLASV